MWKCLFHGVCAALAVFCCLPRGAGTAGDTPLTLLVFDRPPFYRMKDGRPDGGFLLDNTLAFLERAHIPYVVEEMPPGRVLSTFLSRDAEACAVGWFKTPDREAFARFSAPIYRNRPLAVAVSAGACPDKATLADFLAAKPHWGLRNAFSYGPQADALLAALPEGRLHRLSDPARMLPLLAIGRLDAVLIEPEEFSWRTGQDKDLAAAVRLCPLADAPPGNLRYVMCDGSVSPEILARLDAAIGEFMGEAAQRGRQFATMRH
ncbi:transporter substrate-binding domain-containing protein [Solidesulfovibrio sp.]|jgi:polar amino acid transport system substrate-binding protein|uniref:substrate-binding periplasmic protein n=1 Tax=Solidesulfovibrio sp. TaxID=2910990 RepID=UPI000EF10140|nr:transporter substrate-binding domain-containing protein [Solidesulfovibrio sp.]MEA5089420.1 ABC transporter substrate-binding protein [Solidesulfovibrio sp.]HCR12715.1 ABC transporter substrate-binding protein [Desulfovibrio sp.]HML60639.1 ABC transporter substrate-binding protein [Solidesulfovibrio sp.]